MKNLINFIDTLDTTNKTQKIEKGVKVIRKAKRDKTNHRTEARFKTKSQKAEYFLGLDDSRLM